MTITVICLTVEEGLRNGCLVVGLVVYLRAWPRVGSGVIRIDPLCFLARCRKRRLNQALSVLSLSLRFF